MGENAVFDKIKDDYRTPGHPSAFSASANIARHSNVSKGKAQEALEHIDSYVLHKESKKPRKYNPYFVYERRELVQADLIDIRGLSSANDGVNHLFLLIDVFSRKVHVYPLRTKASGGMINAITQYFRTLGGPRPKSFMTDAGTEFLSRAFQTFLRTKNVEFRLAAGTSKACYAERANKTIQILIYKYLTDRETTRYIDVLQDLISTYNSRGHRSLQYMTPNEADRPENHERVLAIATERFGKVKRKKPTLQLADMVRIKTDPKTIDPARRAYAVQYHGEYFKIVRINRTLPIPLYYIKSMNTEETIEQGFYSNELSRARGDVFKVEKIIRRRGRGRNREVLVKWKYFDARWNQWVPANQIVEVFN